MANRSLLTPKERTRILINSVLANNVDRLLNARKKQITTSKKQRRFDSHINSTSASLPVAAECGSSTHWNNTLDFYVSMLNYSLGFGTILGFPSKCYKHGGGIFVIPYLIMLFLEGIPLVCMEIVIGQVFQDKYITSTWGRVHASTIGLGMSAVFVTFSTLVYFNIIVGWCVRYFVYSFQNPLPWSSCPEGSTKCLNGTRPSEYYWYDETLGASRDISSMSNINWDLYLYVFIAWVLVYLYNMKGVKAAVKPGYVFLVVGVALYVTLFMLVVHLDDWARGLAIFFNPKTDELRKLLTIEIWRDAATHVFFSLGIGFGSITVYASYNKIGFNCRYAALCYGLVDTVVGICSCIIVFSFHGFQAHTEEKKCKTQLQHSNMSLITDGSCQSYLSEKLPDPFSLAFITWSDSFTHIRYSNLWASLSYFVLLLSGIGSMSGMVLLVALFLRECFTIRQEFATGLVCLVSCILGLFFVTDSGLYLVNLFNEYTGCPLQWVALIEVFSVVCVFGRKRFCSIVENMTGNYPNIFWRICWFIVSPVILITLLTLHVYDLTKVTSGYQYNIWTMTEGMLPVYYPPWCYVVMGTLCLVPLILIFTMFAVYAFKSRRSLIESCRNSWKRLWYSCHKEEEFELQEFSEFQLRYGRNIQSSVDRIDASFPELLSFNNLAFTPRARNVISDDEYNIENITRHKSI